MTLTDLPLPGTTTVRGACPLDCPDTCALHVTVEDGRAVRVRGDRAHPFTRGGLCVKMNDYEKTVKDGFAVNVFKPGKVEATAARVAQLKAPAGFTVTKFAENVGKPRMLAVASNGDVYVSDRDQGTVMLVRDANKDGRAEVPREVARRPDLHGLAERLSGVEKPAAIDRSIKNYGVGAQILLDLGVRDMIVMSSTRPNPTALEGYGLRIVGWRDMDGADQS